MASYKIDITLFALCPVKRCFETDRIDHISPVAEGAVVNVVIDEIFRINTREVWHFFPPGISPNDDYVAILLLNTGCNIHLF
jgi:hypothetical protein